MPLMLFVLGRPMRALITPGNPCNPLQKKVLTLDWQPRLCEELLCQPPRYPPSCVPASSQLFHQGRHESPYLLIQAEGRRKHIPAGASNLGRNMLRIGRPVITGTTLFQAAGTAVFPLSLARSLLQGQRHGKWNFKSVS